MKKYIAIDCAGRVQKEGWDTDSMIGFYSKESWKKAVTDGRWVYKLVGKLELIEGKPKPFEVGKTYKTTDGFSVRIASTRLYDKGMLGMVDRGSYESYAFFTPAGRRTGGVSTDIGDLVPEKSPDEVILQPSDDGE